MQPAPDDMLGGVVWCVPACPPTHHALWKHSIPRVYLSLEVPTLPYMLFLRRQEGKQCTTSPVLGEVPTSCTPWKCVMPRSLQTWQLLVHGKCGCLQDNGLQSPSVWLESLFHMCATRLHVLLKLLPPSSPFSTASLFT